MAVWFLRIAVLYLVFGVVWGIVMGSREAFAFTNVHARINLLGWATLALAGLIYWNAPKAGNNRLAIAHFWLQNLGLLIFVGGLYLIDASNGARGVPMTIAGSLVTLLALIVFAVNVWVNVKLLRAEL